VQSVRVAITSYAAAVLIDAMKELVRRSYQVYATGDVDDLDAIMADEYVDHNPVPGQGAGRDGVKAKVAATRAGLRDVEMTFQDQLAEGDKVASRITMRACDPSGTPVTARLIAITQITGGRIVAEWGAADIQTG